MKAKTEKAIGIMGYGEVGKAIGSFYKKPFIKDILHDNFDAVPEGGLDVLHVCVPPPSSKPGDFARLLEPVIQKYAKNALVFIHSSVPVGTTEMLGHSAHHRFIVHAPIRGVHPALAVGIKTFPMYIGADFAGAGRLAAEHVESLGITPAIVSQSRTTELAKLLDTTYYGLCIAFHSYADTLCQKNKLNFDRVMGDMNTSYNEGYTKLGKKNVVRPVLYAPEDGKIGGHCVIPNAHILADQFGIDAILQTILRHE